MPVFKRSGKKEMPEIGSSSDIVFMFLFFFMVCSQLRSTEVKVKVKLQKIIRKEIIKVEVVLKDNRILKKEKSMLMLIILCPKKISKQLKIC